jgi:hypothetical protein
MAKHHYGELDQLPCGRLQRSNQNRSRRLRLKNEPKKGTSFHFLPVKSAHAAKKSGVMFDFTATGNGPVHLRDVLPSAEVTDQESMT